MIDRRISHYRILERLGGGGMGEVYKAENTKLQTVVALKFLPLDLTRDEESRQRFRREAQAASSLDHPNICVIHDIDETPEGQLFFSMTYYEGETLKTRIARSRLPVQQALDLTLQVCRGLAKAHAHGIVHRDIKPANLILTADGTVKIVDFGLAKLADRTTLTGRGLTVGTVAYMSPEQAEGVEVDGRSDIWSAGVILYEMLTGRLPFRGDHPHAVLYSIQNQEPASLRELCPDLAPEVERIVSRCLEKDPERRYRSMDELEADLERLAPQGSPGPPKPRRRRRWLAPPMAVLFLALAALVILDFPFGIAPTRHIAVLPFTNVGADPQNQEFCDGLMETLTSQLSRLERFQGSLWVVPAVEVQSRGITSASEARKLFQVNLVLSGSVQRIRNEIRLTLNLIDASSLRQINSEILTTPHSDLASLQDEIVIRTASLLSLELRPESRRVLAAGATTVSSAFELYLRGLGNLARYESPEHIERAIRLFGQAIAQDSLYALAYAGLGASYWRRYENEFDPQWVAPAIRSCQKAAELDALLAPVHVTLGMIYAGTGRHPEAVREYDRALALDPASASALRGLAKVRQAQGRPDLAEAAYRKAIELKPDYWAGYNDLGVYFYLGGRYEEAIEQFSKVVELTPDNIRGYNNLGGINLLLRRTETARGFFRRSLEIGPSVEAFSGLGTVEYLAGEYAEAARMYGKALEINPKDYSNWGNLGNARYWDPDLRPEAAEAYRRAIALAEEMRRVNPRDPYLLADLAGYLVMTGEADRAQTLFDEAVALAPADAYVAFRRAHALETIGERDEALGWFERAFERGLAPDEVEQDPWLLDLREDERFARMVERARDNSD